MRILLLSICTLLLSLYAQAEEKLVFQFETGAVWQHRNDVRIPPTGGSYVEFDQFDQGAFLHYRAEFFYHPGENHRVRLLLAPFNVEVSGQQPNNVNFDGVTFNANQDFSINYTFNSYRLSYGYRLIEGAHELWLGFTGKIRQANITFGQGPRTRTYKNVGFVPLFYFYYQARLAEQWFFVTDMDFAAASQGRAIDWALRVRRSIGEQSQLGVGFRTLEGGADNDKVFTYSWFNYFILDYRLSF